MASLWELLDTIHAIVDTAMAEDLENQPEKIRVRYEPYAQVYFATEEVRKLLRKLIDELRSGRSVTGYLSADYGYGKTATIIYLWKQCLDNNFVAVPPFLFRRLRNIIQATKGWLEYQLRSTRPDLLPELEKIDKECSELSVEESVRNIVSRYSITKAKARAIVKELLVNRGDFTNASIVLSFLESAAYLAIKAGFKGLVVFADESQEFLRTEEGGHREAIQTLSELIKGIRAKASIPFALMLAIPKQPTEAAIEEQAGDIMQRMRERGTALSLHDAYGFKFPRDLWEHLCKVFGDELAWQAVDGRTLESLGQICERRDLSNGPRTVINVFKRIAQHYQLKKRPYTPIDLIDDYLEGHIVFEGRETKLTTTVRRLLEFPIIRHNLQRQQAVKILAAFPHGVDKNKAGELYSVIEELADKEQWLGEHITQLSEGYALVSLQEHVMARPILDEIIRDFRRRWYNIWDEEEKQKLASAGFFKEILPMLFPQREAGQYANFSGHKNFRHDDRSVAFMSLEGCFENLFARFPNRKVSVAVSFDSNALVRFTPPEGEDLDLDFRFFLEFPNDSSTLTSIVTAKNDRRIDFHLNMRRTFEGRFPSDLAFLRDTMAPERTSAQMLLGLSMRMWGWLEEHKDTSEADRQMIEANRRAIHRYALQLLLPDASDPNRVQTIGIKVLGAGQRIIESAFEAKCSELYPDYKPLMITKEWKNYLRHYREAMAKRPLAERRSRQPFLGTKDEIARAFGWSYTAFESGSHILETMGLLEVQFSRGRDAENELRVFFREHPLEVLLRETLKDEGFTESVSIGARIRQVKSISMKRLYGVSRKQGYLMEEVDEAIELAFLRKYLERLSDSNTVQEPVDSLDHDELESQWNELKQRLDMLRDRFKDDLDRYIVLLNDAREYLTNTEDEVALDAVDRKMHELRSRLDEFIQTKKNELAKNSEKLIEELEQSNRNCAPYDLENPIKGSVEFVRHVDDQRKVLQKRFRQFKQNCDNLIDQIRQLSQRAKTVSDGISLCKVWSEYDQYCTSKDKLRKELDTLRPYAAGLQHWRQLVERTSQLRERLEPDEHLRYELDNEFGTTIMEAFALRQQDVLLDYEQYELKLDSIENKIKERENQKRNEFLKLKEQYEQLLGQLISQRIIQATFDPQSPDLSYQLLFQDLLRKLEGFLREQLDGVQNLWSEFDYLINERGIKADSDRESVEQLLKRLQAANQMLNQELVRNLPKFQSFSEELFKIKEDIRKMHEKLTNKRAQKEPPTEEEEVVLRFLTTQRCGLGDLRRQFSLHTSESLLLDELFERLKHLYRKGHIEIEVRRRE